MRAVGTEIETRACEHLITQGCRLIARNFRHPLGEIDLIMRDDAYLIFVEVRFRGDGSKGGALESITLKKRKCLIRAAQVFLQSHKQLATLNTRFDVVGVDSAKKIDWIKNAFWVE